MHPIKMEFISMIVVGLIVGLLKTPLLNVCYSCFNIGDGLSKLIHLFAHLYDHLIVVKHHLMHIQKQQVLRSLLVRRSCFISKLRFKKKSGAENLLQFLKLLLIILTVHATRILSKMLRFIKQWMWWRHWIITMLSEPQTRWFLISFWSNSVFSYRQASQDLGLSSPL